jgi:hypothetical protein
MAMLKKTMLIIFMITVLPLFYIFIFPSLPSWMTDQMRDVIFILFFGIWTTIMITVATKT